jgi:predicted O-methyltransferase YrrM
MALTDSRYRFTEQWFDVAIPTWEVLFREIYKAPIKSILEIGCYEGRATVWLCENVLSNQTVECYDIVDTFGGSVSESGMVGTKGRLGNNNDFIKNTFLSNISFFQDKISFNIHQGMSQFELPKLAQQEKQYDFIYVDASHQSDDTFVDAYFAHKMLKPGGLLIFDDFNWKDPNKPQVNASPEAGIRFFFNLHLEEYLPVFENYQIGVIKKI